MALFANSLRCNCASGAEGRPSVAQRPSSQPPMTQMRHWSAAIIAYIPTSSWVVLTPTMPCPEHGAAMKRRDFIKTIAGAAFPWPTAARTQQSAMPLVGFVHSASPTYFAPFAPPSVGALKKPDMLRVRTWRSNTVGQKVTMSGCRRWRPRARAQCKLPAWCFHQKDAD